MTPEMISVKFLKKMCYLFCFFAYVIVEGKNKLKTN